MAIRQARSRRPPAARRPRRSTSASRRRSRSRCSRPTRSRRPRTRPRRSSSSSPSARSSLALGLDTLDPDRDRGRGAARDRRHVVPADDLRLPERRRQLRRQPREPRRERRRSSPARRCSSTTSSRSRCRSRPASPPSSRSRRSSDLADHRVELGLALIALHQRSANLRGIKESGRLFAVPTYIYIVDPRGAASCYGLYPELHLGDIGHVPVRHGGVRGRTRDRGGTLGLFLILKGFSSGAVALTGVEAISNGVPAFRRPESKNAADDARVDGGHPRHAVLRASRSSRTASHPYPSHDQTVFVADGHAGVRQRRRSTSCCSSRRRRS